MTMELEPIKHGDVVVLAPQGSLNTETSPKLEQKVVELLNASERWFAIDFARVDYISSAGLRILLMMAKRLRGVGGAMALCSLKDDVRKVFTLCAFEREFTIVASRTEALERLFAGTAAPVADAKRPAAVSAPPAASVAPVAEAAPAPVAAAPVPEAAPPPPPPAPEPPGPPPLAQLALHALLAGLAPRPPAGAEHTVSPELLQRATRALSLR